MKNRLGCIIVIALVVTITSCKKTISYPANPLTNYYLTLQVGKYVTYRMDSLNFYYYGQLDTVTSYWAKDSVEKSIVDASGATIWLVTRYLSDTLGDSWTPTITYTVAPTVQTIDVTENNLRFIKLAFPMDLGFSWMGDTYLPYAPYQDFFQYSNSLNQNLGGPGGWNFTYMQVNQPFTVTSGVKYDSATTILQIADSTNVPIIDPGSFASSTYWSETYAKHIGLIYRHTEMWEYQPPTPDGSQSGYKIGFELTMSLIDHN
jgi:hypothetical protein